MELIFLGTGTSHGVPMIGCSCAVCRSEDPRNRRGRSSVHVVMDGLHLQIDAAPEFRLQCVREDITRIDQFILTHEHADHMAGMDDLRRFCDFKGGEAMDVLSTPAALTRVRTVFPYAIMDKPVSKGYVAFRLHEMPERLELPQGLIESTLLPHGKVQTLGLVFTERSSGRKLAYFTDCKTVTPRGIELARGAEVVVLDGLRPQDHPTHMTIQEAVEMAARIGAPANYLTHLTHHVDHGPVEAGLPERVRLAYDGLRLRF